MQPFICHGQVFFGMKGSRSLDSVALSPALRDFTVKQTVLTRKADHQT
jgi:hypothetical protein